MGNPNARLSARDRKEVVPEVVPETRSALYYLGLPKDAAARLSVTKRHVTPG